MTGDHAMSIAIAVVLMAFVMTLLGWDNALTELFLDALGYPRT